MDLSANEERGEGERQAMNLRRVTIFVLLKRAHVDAQTGRGTILGT